MTEPMYQQIAKDLRRQIENGELAAGTQLQTEPELQRRYRASRNTVREAVRWLVNLGMVETRPGQGTFVTEQSVPYVTTLSTDPEAGSSEGPVYYEGRVAKPTASDPPQVEIQQAQGRIATELDLPEGAEVISRHQQRFVDGTPWSLQTSFYPMDLVRRGALRLIQTANMAEGTVRYLEEALGIRQAGYRDTITVRSPNQAEQEFFKIPGDGRVAILAAFRTAFDTERRPIRATITVYPADRSLFEINAGLVPLREHADAGGTAESEQPDGPPARGL